MLRHTSKVFLSVKESNFYLVVNAKQIFETFLLKRRHFTIFKIYFFLLLLQFIRNMSTELDDLQEHQRRNLELVKNLAEACEILSQNAVIQK